jgi:hypothetical protein
MNKPDKLATQDTGRSQTKQWTIQINWQHKTQDEDKQNKGQSRKTGRAHKTPDEDQQHNAQFR